MKNVDINRLPKSWVLTTLGDVCSQPQYGYTTKAANEGDLHLLRTTDITSGVIDWRTVPYCSENPDDVEKYLLEDGDIVISRAGSVGVSYLLENPKQSVFASYLIRFRPFINRKFFRYFLDSSFYWGKISENRLGIAVPNVNASKLKDIPLPLPPLNEQHRIVAKIEALFSELDKGIEALKTAREQLKVYRQAVLKHAFEGKLTARWREENKDKLETPEQLLARIQQERQARYQQQLKDWQIAVKAWEKNDKVGKKPGKPNRIPNAEFLLPEELAEMPVLPVGWIWLKVGHLCDVVRGGSPRPAGDSRYYNGNIPFLKVADLTRGEGCYLSSHTYSIKEEGLQKTRYVEPNTLLISNSGATLGVPKICLIGATFNDGIAAFLGLSNEELLYHYYFWMSKTAELRAINQGAAQPNLNTDLIKEIAIPVCSPEEMTLVAKQIEELLSITDHFISEIDKGFQKSETLRQSILKKAFSGLLVAQDKGDEPAAVLLERIKAEKQKILLVGKRKHHKAIDKLFPANNVIPTSQRIAGISTTDLHAGILALAYSSHQEKQSYAKTFHHVKGEKIAHLVEAHLAIDLDRNPVKDAAGPNDFPHLKKVESRAQKANWFLMKKDRASGAYNFQPGRNLENLQDKVKKALGERLALVESLLIKLRPLSMQQAEIVATLYAAWNNLLLLGKKPDDEEIVFEARENWHPAKLEIERWRFFKGLEWMRENGLVPSGQGRFVEMKTDKGQRAKKRRPA